MRDVIVPVETFGAGPASTSMRASHVPTSLARSSVLMLASQLHVLPLEGLVVDALERRRDPAGDLAGLHDLLHERLDERAVLFGGEPLGGALVPLGVADEVALRIEARL